MFKEFRFIAIVLSRVAVVMKACEMSVTIQNGVKFCTLLTAQYDLKNYMPCKMPSAPDIKSYRHN